VAASAAPAGEQVAEDLARLLLASTGEGIYGVDLQGHCTFANPSCLRLLGFSSDREFLGQHAHDLVHHTRADGTPYPADQCRIYRAFLEWQPTHVDDEVMWRADGSSFPAEYWSHPVERDGELVGCVVTFIDITERRALEQELRETGNQLRKALAGMEEQAAALSELARFPEMNPGPVLRLDLDGRVSKANAAAFEAFGGDQTGRAWRELCPPVDDATWQRILNADATVPIEVRIGEREYVFAHRRDHQGSVVFAFGADVTSQKQAERALRQAERMATLGTLAAGVAHELNNPAAAARRASEQLRDAVVELEEAHHDLNLSGLTSEQTRSLHALQVRAQERAATPSHLDPLAQSDLELEVEEWLDEQGVPDADELAAPLAGQGLDPNALAGLAESFEATVLPAVLRWTARAYPVYTLLHEIGQGSARISEIVGALKSYSYLGQAPVLSIDLHDGIDNTLVILRNKLKGGVVVQRDYCSDLPLVPAYGSELNQVWTNLLDNAVDAMNGKGHIAIRTRRRGDRVAVEIEDDGPGIPPAIQARIFDPFFTTKAPGKGTGLGLATTYSIITEKHRGEIAVESQPGQTRFTVLLPLDLPAPVGDPPASEEE